MYMARTSYLTLTLPKFLQGYTEKNASLIPYGRTHFAKQFRNSQRFSILSVSKSDGSQANSSLRNSAYVDSAKEEIPAQVEVKTWTSTSFSSTGRKYHVFLSFRGTDTRMGFTGHLFDALTRQGINTFMDDENLRPGDIIRPGLLEAIAASRFAIVVLSSNFATSTWCLEELSYIVERKEKMGLIVIPVFYHVYPSDVRHQRNTFEQAFDRLEKSSRFAPQRVKTWRDAFRHVADLSGLHVEGTRYESEVASEIVGEIVRRILQDTKGLAHVFLSFKGRDTRMGFTSHLYDALTRQRINTFRGDENLQDRDLIRPELLEAIEASRFVIVVFSRNYATSPRCLEELSYIVECMEKMDLIVIPVFYHVHPSDIRYQRNTFEEAFAKHETSNSVVPDKAKIWRAALRKVGDISGLHVDGARYESEVISEIVRRIFNDLQDKLPGRGERASLTSFTGPY